MLFFKLIFFSCFIDNNWDDPVLQSPIKSELGTHEVTQVLPKAAIDNSE